jgi:hypothetical protein
VFFSLFLSFLLFLRYYQKIMIFHYNWSNYNTIY